MIEIRDIFEAANTPKASWGRSIPLILSLSNYGVYRGAF